MFVPDETSAESDVIPRDSMGLKVRPTPSDCVRYPSLCEETLHSGWGQLPCERSRSRRRAQEGDPDTEVLPDAPDEEEVLHRRRKAGGSRGALRAERGGHPERE